MQNKFDLFVIWMMNDENLIHETRIFEGTFSLKFLLKNRWAQFFEHFCYDFFSYLQLKSFSAVPGIHRQFKSIWPLTRVLLWKYNNFQRFEFCNITSFSSHNGNLKNNWNFISIHLSRQFLRFRDYVNILQMKDKHNCANTHEVFNKMRSNFH